MTLCRVVSVTQKTVTSLLDLKMADSVPLDSAADSVPIPIARQKTVPKGGHKAVLTDDVKLKLAQRHISSELDVRHVLLISGKRNKQRVVDEMLFLTNEYLFPSQITKPTLSKWIEECIAECVEWEAELSTEEKDGGSKKSGQDNMPDDSHKLAWVQTVQLMSEARALTVEDRPGSAQKKQEVKFDGLTGKTITPSLSAPSCQPRATATRSRRRTWCDCAALHSPSGGWGVRAERELHASCLTRVCRSPSAFFLSPLATAGGW